MSGGLYGWIQQVSVIQAAIATTNEQRRDRRGREGCVMRASLFVDGGSDGDREAA